MLHTTFGLAKERHACAESYKKMADALGGVRAYGAGTPIPLTRVLDVCGLADALWTLRCTIEPSAKFARELICLYAEHILPNFENVYPEDKHPRRAIEAARKYNRGEITIEELRAAESATKAAWAARAAKAVWAARAAWAAGSAADSAVWAAAWAAESAARAAESAAWAAAWAVEETWQKAQLLALLEGEKYI